MTKRDRKHCTTKTADAASQKQHHWVIVLSATRAALTSLLANVKQAERERAIEFTLTKHSGKTREKLTLSRCCFAASLSPLLAIMSPMCEQEGDWKSERRVLCVPLQSCGCEFNGLLAFHLHFCRFCFERMRSIYLSGCHFDSTPNRTGGRRLDFVYEMRLRHSYTNTKPILRLHLKSQWLIVTWWVRDEIRLLSGGGIIALSRFQQVILLARCESTQKSIINGSIGIFVCL